MLVKLNSFVENDLNQQSKNNEQLSWEAGDGRINILVRDRFESYNSLCEFLFRPAYHYCSVILDTSMVLDEDVAYKAEIISEFGNYNSPIAVYPHASITDLAGYKAIDLARFIESNEGEKCYACSVKINKEGKIDWLSVEKSTIHPEHLSKEDIERVCENHKFAVEVVEALRKQKEADEQKRLAEEAARVAKEAERLANRRNTIMSLAGIKEENI